MTLWGEVYKELKNKKMTPMFKVDEYIVQLNNEFEATIVNHKEKNAKKNDRGRLCAQVANLAQLPVLRNEWRRESSFFLLFDESSWTLEKWSSFLGGNPSLVMFPFPFSSFFLVSFKFVFE